MKGKFNIAFFGSSLVSAYWNGAATYYRGIISALHRSGHQITFYEPDAYERQQHRDDVLPAHDPHTGPERLRLLLELVGILGGVQILRMVVNIINGRLGSRIGTAITADVRARLVKHLGNLSIAYYDRQQVGSLVGRVDYDTEALYDIAFGFGFR